MSNAFVDSGVMQVTPNYPPYALPVVQERGGKVISVGEVGHAITYASFVKEIHACDIDRDTVQFYSIIQDAIANMNPEAFRLYMTELSRIVDGFEAHGRGLSAGPAPYIPYIVDVETCDYIGRKLETNGNVHMYNDECLHFLEMMEKNKAGTVLLNNVPEYVGDWEQLFDNMPVELDGIVMLGKRDDKVYEKKGMFGRKVSPGVLRGSLGFYPPGEGWVGTDVRSALRRFGLEPVDVPVVTNTRWYNGTSLPVIATSVGGVAQIAVRASYPLNGQRTYHNLYTLQRAR